MWAISQAFHRTKDAAVKLVEWRLFRILQKVTMVSAKTPSRSTAIRNVKLEMALHVRSARSGLLE